jgi:hypothetical protein
VTTYVGTDRKGPNEIQPTTIDWADFLALTEDTIVDCDILVSGGLEVENRWFTETDTTGIVSGGTDGTPGVMTAHIYCASGQEYERSAKINIKN